MTENSIESFERKLINYIDIGFACFNFIIIIFPLLAVLENIILTIVGCVFASVLFINTLYTFNRNNPFYLYYCYGLILGSLFFLISLLVLNPLMGLIFIPIIIYLIILLKTPREFSKEVHFRSKRATHARYHPADLRGTSRGGHTVSISSAMDLVDPEEKERQERRSKILKERYNFKKIIVYTVILTVSLFVVNILLSIIINRIYGANI